MTDMPQHAAPAVARSRHAAAWVIMLGAGATGMAYNLYLALHGDHIGNVVLACLLGAMPMTLAMLLTHVVGDAAEEWMRWAALAIMLAAMYLSLSATATVVEPGAGKARAYVFGLMLDAAALLAFRVITAARQHDDAAAEAVSAAAEQARQARSDAADARAHLAAAQGELEAAGSAREDARLARAHAEESAARATALQDDLTAARSQLDRALRTLERQKPAAYSRQRQPRASAGDDIATEFKVLDAVKENRDISGKDLGAKVGVSEGHARKLKTAALAVLARDDAGQS